MLRTLLFFLFWLNLVFFFNFFFNLSNSLSLSLHIGLNTFIKRNDNAYESNELDDQELNGANNQKKSKSFVANFKPWGGKRNVNPNVTKPNNQQNANLNGYLAASSDNLPLAIKRVKTEKTFRSWGGKRSGAANYDIDQNEYNAKLLNEYLSRLEALNQLINELDAQNYD